MIDSLFIINKITKIIEFYRFLTLYDRKGGGGKVESGNFWPGKIIEKIYLLLL